MDILIPSSLDRNVEMAKRFASVHAFIKDEGFETVEAFLHSCGCDAPGAARVRRLLHSVCVGGRLAPEVPDPFVDWRTG